LITIIKPKKLKINKNFAPCKANVGDELFPNGIFEFNITKMLEFIKNNPDEVIPTEIKVKEVSLYSTIEGTLDSIDMSAPIILAEIAPGFTNLIDGHHRMAKARRLKIETIMAYKLSVNQHINFLTSQNAYFTYIEYWNEKVRDL